MRPCEQRRIEQDWGLEIGFGRWPGNKIKKKKTLSQIAFVIVNALVVVVVVIAVAVVVVVAEHVNNFVCLSAH